MNIGENEIDLTGAFNQNSPGFICSFDRNHLKAFKFQDVVEQSIDDPVVFNN
nr:hypothetical protein [Pseudomonas sp. BSw22131]